MDDLQPDKPDDGIEIAHENLPPLVRTDVIAGRKCVAGVETDAGSIRLLEPVQNAAQVFEPVSDGSSLTGGDFQQCQRAKARCSPMDTVEGFGYGGNTRLLARPHMRTGVNHQTHNVQRFTAPEFVFEAQPGAFQRLRLDRAQIDEVGSMGYNGIDACAGGGRFVVLDVRRAQRPGLPLIGVLDKHLHRGASDLRGSFECRVHAACDGAVCAKERVWMHTPKIRTRGIRMKNEKQGTALPWRGGIPAGKIKATGGRGQARGEAARAAKRTAKLVVGLMSGTSLDGIDAVLLRVWGEGTATRFEQLAYLEQPFPPVVRSMLLRNSHPESSRIDELTRLNMMLAHLYADAVRAVARKAGVPMRRIDLIGSHGQTVHHLPRAVRIAGKEIRATLQIGDPSALATLTGIPTVGNFRIADMAAGGQGAPLVPYFDWLVFSSGSRNRILLNIGGIANITALPAGCDADGVVAFDTGPGNMVVDGLMKHFYGRRYDRDGRVASRGTVIPDLLAWLSKHPYLRMHPPKSTGRELFGKEFVGSLLRRSRGKPPADIVHTAALFTPLTVYDAYSRFVKKRMRVDEIIVSGGGARNRFFLESLRELFGGVRVETAGEEGMNADAKEAICFAVLANETLAGRPANLPRVTGASKPVVLGCINDPGIRHIKR